MVPLSLGEDWGVGEVDSTRYPDQNSLVQSPGATRYVVDPAKGDDANPVGEPWRSFGRLNAIRLAPGDQVIIAPGMHDETLKPSGAGTADHPIVIRFLPGIHTIAIANVLRIPIFVSNAQDSLALKPVGMLVQGVKHLRMEGGGVQGDDKTTVIFDGRMVQIFNDHSEGITYSGLVFDLKRPTVSEVRALEVGPRHAVIQIAEGSDYVVAHGRFAWIGESAPSTMCQESIPEEGRCWRKPDMPRDFSGSEPVTATDLGGRKVRLDFSSDGTGLTQGHQYQFRSVVRDSVGVHHSRCKDITIRDCDFHALTGMGFVGQFTDPITYQRVNVAPPSGTIRTCPAWADVFHFSNCKGHILVDSCRLSGMQDDALNCHGTYLRVSDRIGDGLLVSYAHPQTFGFAPFIPGDVVAVVNPDSLREYDNNPRRTVVTVEQRSHRDWLITFDGPAPSYAKDDVVDNLTWHPDLTARGNHISMAPVRGFLLATRGRILVQGNTFHRCHMPGILVEGDARNWMESGPIRNLLVQHNRFIDCGISIMAPENHGQAETVAHENIRIEDNYFEDAGIIANGVKGLVVTGNCSPTGVIPVTATACFEPILDNNGRMA